MTSRIERIISVIHASGADALLITQPANRRYASNVLSSAGMVLITADGDRYFLVDSRYTETAEKNAGPLGYKVIDANAEYFSPLNELIKKHNIKSIAIENLYISLAEYNDFRLHLQCELVDVNDQIDMLREVKSPDEVECLVKAQRIAEQALYETLDIFHIGMTERDFASELVYRIFKYGAEALAFNPLILSGPNASMPHGRPSDKVITEGELLLMDFGATYQGYFSDMTRTVAIGYATDEQYEVYNTVLAAHYSGIKALKPGAVSRDVDAAAKKIIADSGLPGCYGHGLGHSVGLDGRILLRAKAGCDSVFQTGNTITIEPGIYIPGKIGCRIEDIMWLSPEGTVSLAKFPKDELLIIK